MNKEFPRYFDNPCQVAFKVSEDLDDSGEVLAGIAYCGEIICACCGGIFELDEVLELEILEWINIREEILGDIDYVDYDENDINQIPLNF